MTPGEINILLRRLDDLHEDVREVKAQAQKTNGRVTSLELWKARAEGARAAFAWLPTTLTALVAAGGGAVIASLLQH